MNLKNFNKNRARPLLHVVFQPIDDLADYQAFKDSLLARIFWLRGSSVSRIKSDPLNFEPDHRINRNALKVLPTMACGRNITFKFSAPTCMIIDEASDDLALYNPLFELNGRTLKWIFGLHRTRILSVFFRSLASRRLVLDWNIHVY